MVMVSQDGWRVERIMAPRVPDGMPERLLRLSWCGYWQADCVTTKEVARYVDLTTLVPTGWAGDRSPKRNPAAAAEAREARRQTPQRASEREPVLVKLPVR